jgi:CDP-diacylglycerol--glycerol-3-phosphate 3-phosphatidyltransferase
MNWKLPNQLTVARVALAVVFFVLLGLYRSGDPAGQVLLSAAVVVYLLAGLTDVLDGYFARKWNLVSAFGRIVDPFVDKLLVVGTFVMLTGGNFLMETGAASPLERELPAWVHGQMTSAVQAWMVVVILAREFVVSALRGYSESRGVSFPATPAGKIKMFVQSAAIVTVLVALGWFPGQDWAAGLKILMVWVTVIVTVVSGFYYVRRAKGLLVSDE